ncbi:MAG TPA: transglutaminase-like domain-containing protein [Planctomycetota bacterium]|nr:transglutaminase-like domain-containing protein [Planctomycetota bacterium]
MKTILLFAGLAGALGAVQVEPPVKNPAFRPNTAFGSHEDLRAPRFEELRVKYRLEEAVKGETDDFKRVLLLRHWLHARVVVEKKGPELPDKDALSTLEEGPKGGRYHCAHLSVALNAVLSAMGHVTRIVLSGPGEKEPARLSGSHGSNEVWCNSLCKWVLVDAEHDSHFEKDGVPLSALEVRDEVLRDGAKSVARVRGLDRRPEARVEDESWGQTARTYGWISWPSEGNRFTRYPEDPGGFQVLYEDEYARTHTWYRDGRKHWAYDAGRFKRISERGAIEWTPNVLDVKTRLQGEEWEVQIASSTPNLKEYQMKKGDGAWERAEEKFAIRVKAPPEKVLLRSVNLAGLCGPEHRLVLAR